MKQQFHPSHRAPTDKVFIEVPTWIVVDPADVDYWEERTRRFCVEFLEKHP